MGAGAEASTVALVSCWESIGNIGSTTCILTFDADVRAVAALVASVATVVSRSTDVPAADRFVVAIASALFRIAAFELLPRSKTTVPFLASKLSWRLT
jgi:hypothetical protein